MPTKKRKMKEMKEMKAWAIVDPYGNHLDVYEDWGFYRTRAEALEVKQRCLYPKWRIVRVTIRESK